MSMKTQKEVIEATLMLIHFCQFDFQSKRIYFFQRRS
jgi:hypothetical protein